MIRIRPALLLALVLGSGAAFFTQPAPAQAQQGSSDAATATTLERTRLILKDGSYQLVLGYSVHNSIHGKVVRYQSAERNGEVEEVPLAMVDLPATEQWAREHSSGAQPDRRPVLSPELAKEEADRAARTPEVAPDLKLPEEDALVALDRFQGTPEIVPLAQEGTDLNKETAHAVRKIEINPESAAHRIGELPGDRADVQLHTGQVAFFGRIGSDSDDDADGSGLVVDTHGQSGRDVPAGGAAGSGYVIERLDTRTGSRVLDSFRVAQLGTGNSQPDVIESKQQTLPGGHWMKLTPAEPLLPGEYALVEVMPDGELNLDVWDFGVHADAPEDSEAQRPQPHKPIELLQHHP
jgi:hypothetical protein